MDVRWVENRKVIVIDDSLYQRELLFSQLTKDGYDVVGLAENAKDGLRMVGTQRPNIVILDISLPDMPTDEIIRGLRSLLPNVFIIVSAPLGMEENIHYLIRVGANEFLPKPIEKSHLDYILVKYEITNFPENTNLAFVINFLHQLYYTQLIQFADDEYEKIIKRVLIRNFKNMVRKYPERFIFYENPLKLDVVLSYNKKIPVQLEKVIIRQIENLFQRNLNDLEKKIPLEILQSLLQESFMSYYSLAKPFIDAFDYSLPEWKNFKFKIVRPSPPMQTERQKLQYISNTEFSWPDIPISPEIERINAYRFENERGLASLKELKWKNDVNAFVGLAMFDEILGPVMAQVTPSVVPEFMEDTMKIIPSLMDRQGLKDMEPFLHSESDFGSLNIVFSVRSEKMRGMSLDLMLSIIVSPISANHLLKLSQMSGILKATAAQILYHLSESDVADPVSAIKLKSDIPDLLNVFLHEVRTFLEY